MNDKESIIDYLKEIAQHDCSDSFRQLYDQLRPYAGFRRMRKQLRKGIRVPGFLDKYQWCCNQ